MSSRKGTNGTAEHPTATNHPNRDEGSMQHRRVGPVNVGSQHETRGMADQALVTTPGAAEGLERATYPADQNPAAVYLAKLAPSGRRTMRIALDRIAKVVRPDLRAETFPWAELRYQHTALIRSRLVEALDPEHEPHYSISTVNTTLAALRGVLKEAWRLGHMTADDLARAADIANVKGHRIPRGRAVSHGEVLAMVDAAKSKGTTTAIRDAGVLALGWACGLRRSEIQALKLANYEPDEGRLVVRGGKGRKDRVVGVQNGAADVLNAWVALRGTDPGPLIQQVTKAGLVTGKPLSGQAIGRRMELLAERAGIKPFTPHDLRRSYITSHLERGTDAVIVARMVGHASVDTTMVYDRRGEKAVLDAAGAVAFPW